MGFARWGELVHPTRPLGQVFTCPVGGYCSKLTSCLIMKKLRGVCKIFPHRPWGFRPMIYVFSKLNGGRSLFRIGNIVACPVLRVRPKCEISIFCRTVGSPDWGLLSGSPRGTGNVCSLAGVMLGEKMGCSAKTCGAFGIGGFGVSFHRQWFQSISFG